MESMVEVRSERVQQSIQGVVIQRTRLKLLFIPVFTSILVWACLVQLWHMRLLSGFTRVTKASVRVDETVHSTTPSESLFDRILNSDVVMGFLTSLSFICYVYTFE